MDSAPGTAGGDLFGDTDDAVAHQRGRKPLDAVADGVFRLNPDLEFVAIDDAFEVAWADAAVGRYFGVDATGLIGRDKRRVVRETMKGRVTNPDRFANRVLAAYDDNRVVRLPTAGGKDE
jgi:hypothetical protein